jgi:TolB-like protein/Tfp pilus assembly protein PilF
VDSPGDNLLAEFPSVVDAVNCAVEIQRDLAERNADMPENRKMQFRIGVNLGDVFEEGERIYGDGVNIAARLETLSEVGGICISGTVYDAIENKIGLEYEYLGEREVKNIAKPVRIYRVSSFPGSIPESIPHRLVKARTFIERKWHKIALTAAAILVLFIGAALVRNFYLGSSPSSLIYAYNKKQGLEIPDEPSIAILPFENMSRDPEQDLLGDGLTDNIITQLYKLTGILVTAKTSSFIYKGKAVKVQEIGRELGVRYVLEGSVQKSGDRIRVNAQLIEAATGNHLWAEKYDRELKSLFDIQDEITRRIITELAVKLSMGEMARMEMRATENYGALTYYFEADQFFNHYQKESNIKARELLQKAVELDPKYARALGFLSITHFVDAVYGWVKNPDQSFKKAEEIANQALAIDKTNYLAHDALAWIYKFGGKPDKAIASMERALEAEPNNAVAILDMGSILVYSGRPVEGLMMLKKAFRLCPFVQPAWMNRIALAYYLTGNFEEAITACEKCLQTIKHGPVGRDARETLIAGYMELGRDKEGGAEAQKLLEEHPDYTIEATAIRIKSWNDDMAFLNRFTELLLRAGLPHKPKLNI